ncbi:hypothetical protein DUI87_05509 [Hirundo rustica rustica]|uniref:Uncharacterized protein n=1 Tax=Hirundo rustica rustica TaxID=333673 RepID=A0A3M0KX13_HIRRU|nr:hypothetical protein DUI87_05509 [Hirundo rustica rustica]
MSVPSPLPCPEPRQTSAGKDGQSPLSLAFSSTMFSQGLWRLLPLSGLLLPLSGLLLLVQPLEPSSPAAGDAGTWDAPAEALEEQDVAQLRATMLVLEALPWICTALALLLKGLRLCWVLGKGLRRRWGEDKSRSASASARPCCRGHGCSRELLPLLLENRALMRRCLRHSSRQRPAPRGKRPRRPGTRMRRRLRFSPLL